jgi:peptide/nickel transport system substrate-binding protein
MKRIRKVAKVAASVGGIVLLTCLSFGGESTRQTDAASTVYPPLIVAQPAGPNTLDPANTSSGTDVQVTQEIFQTLVTYKLGTNKIIGLLATNWKTSRNGLVWTFYLRHGVRFDDGATFNASAVVFNFDRWWNPKDPYHKGQFGHFMGDLGGFKGMKTSAIASVRAVGPYTVQIRLAHPFAPFLAVLTQVPYGFASPAGIRKHDGNITNYPDGTGPFKLKSWSQGNEVILVRNPYYWQKGYPKSNELVFKVIPNAASALTALETGEIDVSGVEPQQIPTVRADHSLRLDTFPGNNVGYMAINLKDKPFNLLKVREAVEMAINRKALVNAFFDQAATVAQSILPSENWAYDATVRNYSYNPTKARQLLKEAGYPHGFSTQLWTMNTDRPYFPDPEDVATAIQADLAQIGIHAQIVTYDFATYLQKTADGDAPLALHGWIGATNDPSPFFNLVDGQFAKTPALNISFFVNKTVDRLLTNALTVTSQAQRARLYKEAEQIIAQQVPVVPIDDADGEFATVADLHGFNPTVIEGSQFMGAWIGQ